MSELSTMPQTKHISVLYDEFLQYFPISTEIKRRRNTWNVRTCERYTFADEKMRYFHRFRCGYSQSFFSTISFRARILSARHRASLHKRQFCQSEVKTRRKMNTHNNGNILRFVTFITTCGRRRARF